MSTDEKPPGAPSEPLPFIASRPTVGEPEPPTFVLGEMVHVDYAAGTRQTVSIDAPPPDDQHPAPWKWGTAPVQRRLLFDGAGRIILFSGNDEMADDVRALTEAAPELRDLLGAWMQEQDASPRTCCATSIDSPGDHADDCLYGQTRALLDRLRKAR